MEDFKKHELFEIEVLEKLKNSKLLEPLVFGGGTMLRLCYELNRYSIDLDLWFIKKVNPNAFFKKLKDRLEDNYEITDAQIKFFTLLFEIRSTNYPKRLKIEIRKEPEPFDLEERIAFSKYGTKQVILKVLTLEQALKNKIEAALERKDIRDFFDIEFILRQGATLNADFGRIADLNKIISTFKRRDFCVTLGSLLDPETRKYYIDNKFDFLQRKINEL